MKKEEVENKLNALIVEFNRLKGKREPRLKIAKQFLLIKNKHIYLFQDDISNGVPDHEVWVNCKGWEVLYQISNFGRIRNHETFFIKHCLGHDMAVYKPKMIRSKHLSSNGYVTTGFWLNEKVSTFNVHRLVAFHFIPNPKKYEQVLHIDDNPANPHFRNLKWGTQKHNIQDCIEKGRWHLGAKNNKTKLTEQQIPIIRQLLAKGVKLAEIARKFNVTSAPISYIRDGKTWKHLK